MRSVSCKSCRENQNTHFILNIFHKNRAVYEIMCKNRVESDRPQMIIRRMRIACRITKATNTEYVMRVSVLGKLWLRERSAVLHSLPALFS
jgi:hypothetical protein